MTIHAPSTPARTQVAAQGSQSGGVQVERERSSSPPLSLSLGHPLAGQTLRRGIEMTGTEETPVVASKAEEVVKLNNSFKEACVITKSEQVDDKEKSH